MAEAGRDEKVLVFLCLISGVIFLLAVFYLNSRTSEFKKNGIETQAEIVLIEKDYDTDGEEKITVYVEYTAENTTYTRKLDYYSFTLHEGDIITILYLPEDPSEIIYPEFNTVPQTLFFVGEGICIAAGLAYFVAIVINKSKRDKLKENGLIAIVKQFDYRRNLRVFGKYPASLVCTDSTGNYYKTRFLYDAKRGTKSSGCRIRKGKNQKNILSI